MDPSGDPGWRRDNDQCVVSAREEHEDPLDKYIVLFLFLNHHVVGLLIRWCSSSMLKVFPASKTTWSEMFRSVQRSIGAFNYQFTLNNSGIY